MAELVAGVITWNFSGQHFLDTFQGRFEIPDTTINTAWDKLVSSGIANMADVKLSGTLARGRIRDGYIVDISYLINGRELPARSD